jgi:hypothetical protein
VAQRQQPELRVPGQREALRSLRRRGRQQVQPAAAPEAWEPRLPLVRVAAEPPVRRALERPQAAVPQQLQGAPVRREWEVQGALRSSVDERSLGRLAAWSQSQVLREERRCSPLDGEAARSCADPAELLVLAEPQEPELPPQPRGELAQRVWAPPLLAEPQQQDAAQPVAQTWPLSRPACARE